MSAGRSELITLVLENGAVPAGTVPALLPFAEAIRCAQGEDLEVVFDLVDSARAAVVVPMGASLRLVARRHYYDEGDPLINALAEIYVIPDPPADPPAHTGRFLITAALTAALLPFGGYEYGVVYIDADGLRFQVKPASPAEVEPSIAPAPLE